MQKTFNLLEKPFLRCTRSEHSQELLNLKQIFLESHLILDIDPDSPLERAALYRFLLTFLYRIFGIPQGTKAWQELWEQKQFNADQLNQYFDQVHNRFDLYSKEFPFMQVTGYLTEFQTNTNSLYLEKASASNKTLFDHSYDAAPGKLSDAELAVSLITNQCFSLGGGKSQTINRTAGNGAKGLVVFIKGSNLFETLLLNYCKAFTEVKVGTPAWERDDFSEPLHEQAKLPDGICDYLTWQVRAIQQNPENPENPWAPFAHAQGRVIDDTAFQSYETLMTQKQGEKGWYCAKIDPERVVWRDLEIHLQYFSKEDTKRETKPPANIQFYHELLSDRKIKKQLNYTEAKNNTIQLELIGMSNDRAKVNLWRRETYLIPINMVENKETTAILRRLTNRLEEAHQILTSKIKYLAKQIQNSGSEKDRKKFADDFLKHTEVSSQFWAQLENPFRQFLVDFASSEEISIAQWMVTQVKPVLHSTFQFGISKIRFDPRFLKICTEAEKFFNLAVYKFMEEYQKEIDNVQQQSA